MHLTGEVTLGNIAIVVTLLGIAIKFGVQLGGFQTTLREHAKALEAHSIRLDHHETRILDLIAGIQRLIGRSEVEFRQFFRQENS
jgi:hypothetical protein